MNKLNFPDNENLLAFVERMDRYNYYEINALCDVSKKQAQRLQELEVHQPASSYTTTCISLIEKTQRYIGNKKEHFVPYVQSLSEKVADGHDCSNCTGNGCSLQHDMQLTEIKQAHVQLKEILNGLQVVALPLYSDTIYPDVYRVLRNNIALLENSLAELFLLEETYLIPKITEAQEHIHVRS